MSYETWMLFTTPADCTSAPFAFAWRRSEQSEEVIWAVSVQFEKINLLRLRAGKIFEAAQSERAEGFLLMHACFRKAAELAADWTEGRDLQRLWPEISAEQLDKASQVCLGFAHADVIARLPAVDKRARAWGALHTLLLQKPKLYDADEPAELQRFGAGAVDDQLRVLQAGARVFWLLDSAKGHFDVGKVETASACAKQAVSVARAEFGHADVAQYFDTNILDHAAKQNGNYEYVRDKVSASLIDFHANMCAQPVVLPTLSVPLPNVYVRIRTLS